MRLIQDLDDRLDIRSFQLADLKLGNLLLDLPNERGAFTGEFDFVDQRGFVLQVTAGMDAATGTATWLLRAVDPDTGLLVSDAAMGLLKPGESAEVGYTVLVDSASESGDQILAQARAIVDDGTPLDTLQQVHTIDAVPPTTQLAVEDLGGGSFRLAWQSADDLLGSGAGEYAVYVSRNGGDFGLLERRIVATELTYAGSPGEDASLRCGPSIGQAMWSWNPKESGCHLSRPP